MRFRQIKKRRTKNAWTVSYTLQFIYKKFKFVSFIFIFIYVWIYILVSFLHRYEWMVKVPIKYILEAFYISAYLIYWIYKLRQGKYYHNMTCIKTYIIYCMSKKSCPIFVVDDHYVKLDKTSWTYCSKKITLLTVIKGKSTYRFTQYAEKILRKLWLLIFGLE